MPPPADMYVVIILVFCLAKTLFSLGGGVSPWSTRRPALYNIIGIYNFIQLNGRSHYYAILPVSKL